MTQVWQNLQEDLQVALRILGWDCYFRQFVEESLPLLLQDISDETLTLEKLMEAQFLCAKGLANLAMHSSSFERFEKIKHGLSQHEDAGTFLAIIGMDETTYWQRRPGLTDAEYQEVKHGQWTVQELLERRPALILAPCLRPTSFNN